jgi:hypothetical protein
MYKFLLVFIVLLVILIIALNIGVLPSLNQAKTEGLSNSQKRVTWIGYRTGGRIDQISFGYNTLEAVDYGGNGGHVREDILFAKDEYIIQVQVYGNIGGGGQFRGGKYNFKTNRRDIILDTNPATSPNSTEEGSRPVLLKSDVLQYMIPVSVSEDSKPIIGLKWTSDLNAANKYIRDSGYVPGTQRMTSIPPIRFCADVERNAWLVDVEYGSTPPIVDERLFKQLFEMVNKETGFSFDIVEARSGNDSHDTILSTAQHLDYVHNIRLYDILSSGSINPNHSEYVKLIQFIKTLKESGINTMNELVGLQTDIRMTKSSQGFSTMQEGLTSDGRLTDAEAVCYLNSTPAARQQVSVGYAVEENEDMGLNFTIYNTYFNLNLFNGGLNMLGGRNPYLHQPGHNGFSGTLELSRLFEAQPNAANCSADFMKVLTDPNNQRLDRATRNNGGFCIIGSGVTMDLANITIGTKDILTRQENVLSNSRGEYYTVVWNGFFRPDVTGNWRFRAYGDDAIYVFLDTGSGFPKTLNDVAKTPGTSTPGLHGYAGKEGRDVHLEKGRFYPYMVIFGENWGGDNMHVSFRGPSNSRASNWTSNGKMFYFRSSSTSKFSVPVNKQDTFPLPSLNVAKQHWEMNGKPPVSCTPALRNGLISTDAINYGKSNYGDYNHSSNTLASKITNYQNEWVAQGKPDTYIYTLPKVESFVEGLAVDETQIDKYAKEMSGLGVSRADIPLALRDFKVNYGIDIANPGKTESFFRPLKEFGITDYKELRSFKNSFMSDNAGFITLSQLPEYIQYISGFGMKYSVDAESNYQKFVQAIVGYGINTFNNLKNFHKILESIGYPASTNPISLINSITPYGVNNYNKCIKFVEQMNNYLTDKSKGPEIVNALVSYSITLDSFDGFRTNSHGISSSLVVQYITAYKTFGLSYLGRSNDTNRYKQFYNIYVAPVAIVAEQGEEAAMKNIKVINMYKGYGYNSYAELIDTSTTRAKNVGNSDAIISIYAMATNQTIMLFLRLTEQTKVEFKNRLNQALDDAAELFPGSICNITLFFTTLYNTMKLTYDVFKTYINTNKTLFMAQIGDHISCQAPTSRERQGFTTIESMDTGHIFKSTTPFGITDYTQAAYNTDTKSYIDINSLNSTFSMFEIKTVNQYKLFMDEMVAFGVTNQNVINYTNKLSEFGIKYNNFLSFTIYIRTIGVKYSGFDKFINAIMQLGVYAKDLLSFLCYMYEFGITYEDNDNSDFFKFINIMNTYGLRYVPVSNEDQSIRFTNAVQNFVYIISRGEDILRCDVQTIDTDAAESREKITNNAKTMVTTGKNKYKIKNYARYMFPFTHNSRDSITITIPALMDICKTLDPELLDFCTLNPSIKAGKLGFICDGSSDNNGYNLNLPDANGKITNSRALHLSYRKFMKYFTSSGDVNETRGRTQPVSTGPRDIINEIKSGNSDNKSIIDVGLVTTFMQDTADKDSMEPRNEYNNLYNKQRLTRPDLIVIIKRMETYNTTNHGDADKATVYAYYNLTLNALKMFPNFSIAYIKFFIQNSPDMNIPPTLNDKPHPRAAANPQLTRCSPYIKVEYDKKLCSESFGSRLNYSQTTWSAPSISGQPVQMVGGAKPTIQSNSFTTLKRNDKYATANW